LGLSSVKQTGIPISRPNLRKQGTKRLHGECQLKICKLVHGSETHPTTQKKKKTSGKNSAKEQKKTTEKTSGHNPGRVATKQIKRRKREDQLEKVQKKHEGRDLAWPAKMGEKLETY